MKILLIIVYLRRMSCTVKLINKVGGVHSYLRISYVATNHSCIYNHTVSPQFDFMVYIVYR